MLEFARNLQFEKAAQVRDQLGALRGRVFGLGADELEVEVGKAA